MSSCERPSNSSGSDFGPSSVANLYCFSTGTHGSSQPLILDALGVLLQLALGG